jgi:[calcium/calmodulin-dependent protein kinase] kinase
VAALIEPPTEEELDNAITGNMGSLIVVVGTLTVINQAHTDSKQMKAVKKFKQLLVSKRPELMEGIFGRASRIVQPPLSMLGRSKSDDVSDRKPVESALTSEGIHRDIAISDNLTRVPEQMELEEPSKPGWAERLKSKLPKSREKSPAPVPEEPEQTEATAKPANGKGQAHNPLEDTLILGIGTGETDVPPDTGDVNFVSESPGAVDINVYEKAYQDEIDRITREKGGSKPRLYLTRRVEKIKEIRDNEHITDYLNTTGSIASNLGFKKLVEQAKANAGNTETKDGAEGSKKENHDADVAK